MANIGIPSRNVADDCIAEMERESQRERDALSAFYRRESLRKRPMPITGTQVFWWCVFTLAVLTVLVIAIVGD